MNIIIVEPSVHQSVLRPVPARWRGAAAGCARRTVSPGARRGYGIAARVAAAIAGGYVLASLAAVALTVALPLDRTDAVLFGMMVWVFAARSAVRAWAGMGLASAALAAIVLAARWHDVAGWLP